MSTSRCTCSFGLLDPRTQKHEQLLGKKIFLKEEVVVGNILKEPHEWQRLQYRQVHPTLIDGGAHKQTQNLISRYSLFSQLVRSNLTFLSHPSCIITPLCFAWLDHDLVVLGLYPKQWAMLQSVPSLKSLNLERVFLLLVNFDPLTWLEKKNINLSPVLKHGIFLEFFYRNEAISLAQTLQL